jgi:hypothetical protein
LVAAAAAAEPQPPSQQPKKVPPVAAPQPPQRAEFNFPTREAWRRTHSGAVETSRDFIQLNPARGGRSPVAARFGQDEVRVAMVWWEVVQPKEQQRQQAAPVVRHFNSKGAEKDRVHAVAACDP